MNAAPRSLVLCLLLASNLAFACGHCVEDQVAAVYDHALVKRILGRGYHVAFFALDGSLESNSQQRSIIERAATRIAGVDARSVRVSIESSALAVGFDPARTSAEKIRQSVMQALVLKGVSVQLLRDIDRHLEATPGY